MNALEFKRIKDWAAANKSDPFAFNVAMSHHNNGISGYDDKGDYRGYEADAYTVERHLPDGLVLSNGSTSYPVREYRNVKRP